MYTHTVALLLRSPMTYETTVSSEAKNLHWRTTCWNTLFWRFSWWALDTGSIVCLNIIPANYPVKCKLRAIIYFLTTTAVWFMVLFTLHQCMHHYNNICIMGSRHRRCHSIYLQNCSCIENIPPHWKCGTLKVWKGDIDILTRSPNQEIFIIFIVCRNNMD